MNNTSSGRPDVLKTADSLIHGDRRQAYGPVEKSFDDLAAVWSILIGSQVTSTQAGLCLLALKLLRESYAHQFDNLVDLAGYAALIQEIYDAAVSPDLRA